MSNFHWMESFRQMLFLLKIGALQYAILKTVLSVFSIILWTNGNFDLSNVSNWNGTLLDCTEKKNVIWYLNISLHLFQLEITGAAIWINPFIGILTITSLWPVGILFMNTKGLLRSLNIVPKYAMYQVSEFFQSVAVSEQSQLASMYMVLPI